MIARDRSIYGNDFDGRSAVVVGRMLGERLSMVEFVGNEIRRAKVLALRFGLWILGKQILDISYAIAGYNYNEINVQRAGICAGRVIGRVWLFYLE